MTAIYGVGKHGRFGLGLTRKRAWIARTCAFALLAALNATAPSVSIAQDQTVLRVYGSIEVDELDDWVRAFEKDNPNIKLSIVRGSTGVLTARILAEAANPGADVIWRLANTSLIEFSRRNLLETYRPSSFARIAPQYRGRDVPPTWVGHVGYMGALCVNKLELQRLGIGSIRTWNDLLDERLRGKIVMPSPASSGTGLLHLLSWLGQQQDWSYARQLDRNVAYYTTSGSKPCSLAASGEFAIGLSFSTRGEALKKQGAPIDVVFPRSGVGWDLEGSAILKGARNLPAAQQFMDWVTGARAMELYAQRYPIVGTEAQPRGLPAESTLLPFDFYAIAKDRQEIIGQWEREFAEKVKP